MASTSTAIEIRSEVQQLQAAAYESRKHGMKTLDRAFVRSARLHPFRFMMADGKYPKVSFGSALVKTMFIAPQAEKPDRPRAYGGHAVAAVHRRSAHQLCADVCWGACP